MLAVAALFSVARLIFCIPSCDAFDLLDMCISVYGAL